MGFNKTGIGVAPMLSKEMIAGMEEFPPSSSGDDSGIAQERVAYAVTGEPAGSLPPPASFKQVAKSALQTVHGARPNLFVDKLAERLAFERRGTRVYQAIISKFDAYGTFDDGPQREDLEQICADELAHFHMLRLVIENAGGDPTAVTPSANFHAVATQSMVNAIADPRTDLIQALEGALVLELSDNDCWEALIDMARSASEADAAEQFSLALAAEREHLTKVRMWLAAAHSHAVASGIPREAAVPSTEPTRSRTRGSRSAAAHRSSGKRSSATTTAKTANRSR